mmetsp:Transcript_14273/g.45621  ORF Transcript_14273/g.45621 Transcript_14273/m.45621 type:complete len:136 (+) Transcript_14273:20-427(+)
MVKVVPVNKHTIVKKRTKKFRRWQSHQFKRVPESWRVPHGIDGRFRRRFRGTGVHPGIGYGSNKRTRNVLPNHLYKFRVFNVEDLELLMMHNRKYCAEIASAVSARKRIDIIKRAKQLNVVVLNENAKLRAEEHE